MFLMHEMSHILGYVGAKIENIYDDLFGDYSDNTFNITSATLCAIDIPIIVFSYNSYGPDSLKMKLIVLILAAAEFCFGIVSSILTVIMKNVDYRMAYHTRAVALSCLMMAATLGFAILTCLLPSIN